MIPSSMASVAEEMLLAYAATQISIKELMALTISSDHERQMQAWTRSSDHGGGNSAAQRHLLMSGDEDHSLTATHEKLTLRGVTGCTKHFPCTEQNHSGEPQVQDRIVICVKWGKLFPADYVNVLFRAVSAHLEPGFRFICLTDRTNGLESGITTCPIPDIGLTPEQINAPGVWRKLALFHPDVAALAPGARALFIDLDMMVVGQRETRESW